MKKVYCKDCKYFNKSVMFYHPLSWRECRLEGYLIDKWDKPSKKYHLSPATKNNTNKCLDHKRKWWKVWVR